MWLPQLRRLVKGIYLLITDIVVNFNVDIMGDQITQISITKGEISVEYTPVIESNALRLIPAENLAYDSTYTVLLPKVAVKER